MIKIKSILFVVVLFVYTVCVQAGYLENFDNSDAGWRAATINNGGVVRLNVVDYHNTGGNTGGYISYQADNPGNRLYGFEPADLSVFGDLNGENLSVDYKIDGEVTTPDNAMVRFYLGSRNGGSNYFVSNDAYSFSPNVSGGWQNFSVDLFENNFIRWPNQDANNKTFREVLSGIEDIGLVFSGNFTSNRTLGVSGRRNTIIGIDNFSVSGGGSSVPEPATVLLLGISGLVLVQGKRK
jgi:hypothetical protein